MKFEHAIKWLIDHGAPPRLVLHGQIVGDVAEQLSQGFFDLGVQHDGPLAVSGAALHDAGKLVYPEELDGPGSQHELAGKLLLLSKDMPAEVAEMCVAHARWSHESTIEQLIVALADHLWRGRRTADLESLLIQKAAVQLRVQPWEVCLQIEPILDSIASDATGRLAAART